MQATFERKPDFCFTDFVVEGAVTVSGPAFSDLLKYPLTGREFITDHIPQMYTDKNGIRHCLLIMGEGRTDGLLVDSEGAEYAYYASYIPEATDLRYPSLMKMNQMLSAAVDFIISDGTSQTTDGYWHTSFCKLKEQTGWDVDEDVFLQEILAGMLLERPEVADLELEDDFEVTYHPEFCPHFINQEEDTPGEFIQK